MLELGEGAQSSFAIFRGEAVNPNDISVDLIDSRGQQQSLEEIAEEIRRRGFNVTAKRGELSEDTLIKFSVKNYEEAVLLGRFVAPVPKFELIETNEDELTLVLGKDFEALPLIPKTFEEVDAYARPSLPVSEKLLPSDENSSREINHVRPILPVRQGEVSPMQLVKEIDGQPPSGQKC
mgnify:FL=1